MDRITRSDVEMRCINLNRRFEQTGSKYRYTVEQRNGYTAIDRVMPTGRTDGGPAYCVASTVTVGTKREVADFLFAAMIAIDDAGTRA